LLIEAKAHDQELIKEETGRKSIEAPVTVDARRNLMRIDWAIRDASTALSEDTGLPWSLSRDWNYQMSNRFAWAWKLTDLGIPVVLVYLGFLSANEMSDRGKLLADGSLKNDRRGVFSQSSSAGQKPGGRPEGPTLQEHWPTLVKGHSQVLFPSCVWDQRWACRGQAFIPLIRSLTVSLETGISL
jgi:hypothetical protein